MIRPALSVSVDSSVELSSPPRCDAAVGRPELVAGAGSLLFRAGSIFRKVGCLAVLVVWAAHPSAAVAAEFKGVSGEPGIAYRNDKMPREPWSIHVVQIDRSRKDLGFFSAHAHNRVTGVSLIAEQARSIPREVGRAIAAVNGDFYVRDNPPFSGDPRGLQIVSGELISAPDTVCVWFDPGGGPHLDEVKSGFQISWPDGRKIPFGLNEQRRPNVATLYTSTYGPSTRASGGREVILERNGDSPWLPLRAGQTYHAKIREVQANGNSRLAVNTMVLSFSPQLVPSLPDLVPGLAVELSTATTPDLKGVTAAIAGGPAIVKNGQPFSSTPPAGLSNNYSQRSRYERHPRSAVGWSPTHVYLVTVDGRQADLSVGMTLAELGRYMVGLGCTDAMNLDGGKSAQMWLKGEIANSPCQGEDTVANSLVVVRLPVAP